MNGHPHPIADMQDRSRFFQIVLQRGSGAFLSGVVHAKPFWSHDIEDALRIHSVEAAAMIAAEVPKIHIRAQGYAAMKALAIKAASGA